LAPDDLLDPPISIDVTLAFEAHTIIKNFSTNHVADFLIRENLLDAVLGNDIA